MNSAMFRVLVGKESWGLSQAMLLLPLPCRRKNKRMWKKN